MFTTAKKLRSGEKPSIYPQSEPELILVQTNSGLEQQIAAVRYAGINIYQGARARVQGVVDRWIGVEHAVENRVKFLKPPDESLTPGALYVGVAALTGSVLARNRSFLLRLSLPPALFFISMKQFLPKTSHNISSYLSSLEQAYVPAFADAHKQLNQSFTSASLAARMAWENARETTYRGTDRTIAELQNRTGLKLKEVLGWSHRALDKVEAEAKDVVKGAEKSVEELRK